MTERRQPEDTPRADRLASTPRWERESEEALRPLEQEPQPTTELEFPLDFDEDDGQWPEREPRLAGARESLSATRESVGESLAATRESLSATASKVGRWLHSLDRRPEFHAGRDPVAELTSGNGEDGRGEPGDGPAAGPGAAAGPALAARAEDEAPSRDETSAALPTRRRDERPPAPTDDERDDDGIEIGVRFPTAPLGYNRQAVDSHIAMLEEEITELREHAAPPLSIEEEIERLGEETASILVVAHDKAHETARRAQQQAARAVSEAAADAERITAAAEQRLRELDEETDAVWRERERLLEDVREVSRTLATLADAASERFPAAPEPSASAGNEEPVQSTPAPTGAPSR